MFVLFAAPVAVVREWEALFVITDKALTGFTVKSNTSKQVSYFCISRSQSLINDTPPCIFLNGVNFVQPTSYANYNH